MCLCPPGQLSAAVLPATPTNPKYESDTKYSATTCALEGRSIEKNSKRNPFPFWKQPIAIMLNIWSLMLFASEDLIGRGRLCFEPMVEHNWLISFFYSKIICCFYVSIVCVKTRNIDFVFLESRNGRVFGGWEEGTGRERKRGSFKQLSITMGETLKTRQQRNLATQRRERPASLGLALL